MELFRSANIDWLGKKWYFLGFSLIFSVAGLMSMCSGTESRRAWTSRAARRSPFSSTARRTRTTFARRWTRPASRCEDPADFGCGRQRGNKVIIALPESTAQDTAHDAGPQRVENALTREYHDSGFTCSRWISWGRRPASSCSIRLAGDAVFAARDADLPVVPV